MLQSPSTTPSRRLGRLCGALLAGRLGGQEAGRVDNHPDWAPDGRRLVFASNQGGPEELFSAALDGTGVVRLTRDPRRDTYPTFSSVGRRIAFITLGDGRFVVSTTGTTGGPRAAAETRASPCPTRRSGGKVGAGLGPIGIRFQDHGGPERDGSSPAERGVLNGH